MNAKTVSHSKVSVIHKVLPKESNVAGNTHGGEILRHLDSAAAICASRHARSRIVTAAIERMDFLAPVFLGDILIFNLSVNAVHKASMEVGARIEAEDCITGNVRHVGSSYVTFVGIDENGKPKLLPPLIAETETEKRRLMEGTKRILLSRLNRKSKKEDKDPSVIKLFKENYCAYKLSGGNELPRLPSKGFFAVCPTKNGDYLVIHEELSKSSLATHSRFCISNNLLLNTTNVIAAISSALISANIEFFNSYSEEGYNIFVKTQDLKQTLELLESIEQLVSN